MMAPTEQCATPARKMSIAMPWARRSEWPDAEHRRWRSRVCPSPNKVKIDGSLNVAKRLTRSGVVDAAGNSNDVISFNSYHIDPSAACEAYAATGKPSVIGEFSFRGADSGLPNTNGARPVVATQAERAAGFRHYVTSALRQRTVVGYRWFEHPDQPAAGRFDGENSNFGTVTIDDHIYKELTQTMMLLNGEAEDLHTEAAYAIA